MNPTTHHELLKKARLEAVETYCKNEAIVGKLLGHLNLL